MEGPLTLGLSLHKHLNIKFLLINIVKLKVILFQGKIRKIHTSWKFLL